MYVNGAKHFTVITEHKPLERIWQKAQPPLRIERWSMRLLPYKLTIKYRPGVENPADYMSRHPPEVVADDIPCQQKLAEAYVNWVAESSVPKAMTFQDVKLATARDKTLQEVMRLVRTNRWFETKLQQANGVDLDDLLDFKNVRDELTCHSDGILLCGTLLVIPSELRDKAVKLAHEGHQGINRTKSLIRSKVWFPGINAAVEKAVHNCAACQATCGSLPKVEPLQMSAMPDGPWQELSMDFCGSLPTGEYLLSIHDEFSRYPVMEVVKSTSANSTIPVLDKVISMFGIPREIKTDNGPPFNSHEFAAYAKHIGFKHRRITPRWPKANAQVEAFNKPLMKAIRAARIEKKNWKQELQKFLRQYRSTPHPSTGFSPHRLLFGRDPVTRMPELPTRCADDEVAECAKHNDKVAKSKMKQYADARNQATHRDLEVGDCVLVKSDQKFDKFTPTFVPDPYVVTQKKGSMITAANPNHRITRNASCFKHIPPRKHVQKEEEDELEPTSKQTVTVESCPEITNETVHESGSQELSAETVSDTDVKPKRKRHRPKYLEDYIVK